MGDTLKGSFLLYARLETIARVRGSQGNSARWFSHELLAYKLFSTGLWVGHLLLFGRCWKPKKVCLSGWTVKCNTGGYTWVSASLSASCLSPFPHSPTAMTFCLTTSLDSSGAKDYRWKSLLPSGKLSLSSLKFFFRVSWSQQFKGADTWAPWCPQRYHQCLGRYHEHSDSCKERLHFWIILSSLFYWDFEGEKKMPAIISFSLTPSVGSYNSLGSLLLTMDRRLTFFHGQSMSVTQWSVCWSWIASWDLTPGYKIRKKRHWQRRITLDNDVPKKRWS